VSGGVAAHEIEDWKETYILKQIRHTPHLSLFNIP
jgi:hypothetical protein